MKIEKVNENQIRCVLSREDLADRQIKLSELAYGSEKAKTLFREMIQKANYEVGFEADDVPLMVEAIPVSAESIILVITKVEYPDELDTRFSKFTEGGEDADEPQQAMDFPKNDKGAADILDIFEKIKQANQEALADAKNVQAAEQAVNPEEEAKALTLALRNMVKMFEFGSLDEVARLATVLRGFYKGETTLYKDEQKGRYYLLVQKNEHSPEEYNKVCNITSEYAKQKNYTAAVGAHLEEHAKLIRKGDALDALASLNA